MHGVNKDGIELPMLTNATIWIESAADFEFDANGATFVFKSGQVKFHCRMSHSEFARGCHLGIIEQQAWLDAHNEAGGNVVPLRQCS